jgi:small subunit ribosomal protein S21
VLGVTLQSNENIDRAIRRFKKKYERSGILREYRGRTAFIKPSMKKRQQRIKASRRQYRFSKEMNR